MTTEMIQMNWKSRVGFAVSTEGALVGLFLIYYLLAGKLYKWEDLVFQGVFFGVFMAVGFPYLFGKSANRLGQNSNSGLDPDGEIETEGPVNLFGVEAVGGKLFLTNQKLIFKSHKLNIRTGQSDILFDAVLIFKRERQGN